MPITLVSSQPWARYHVTTGKLIVGGDGGEKREFPIVGLQFAVDPENAVPGFLYVDKNSRDFVAAKLNQPPPKAPSDKHVWTLALLIHNPNVLGAAAFEICDTSLAYKRFAERLFNSTQANFGKGEVPVIRITDAAAVTGANGSSALLSFAVEKWVERPAAIVEAVQIRDSIAAARPPDHPPNNGNSYAAATGRDPVVIRRDLDDEIPF